MNILLIGGTGAFIDELILKFRKEGHKVFLLTGEKYRKTRYEKVFEKYNFTYDCEELSEILDSVNPDITVFMGAYDSNFHWYEAERETVRFTSCLINILVASSKIPKNRFIFLSSGDVFSGNFPEEIGEETEPDAMTPKEKTLIQAEQICANFRKNWEMDILVLRLDHLYGIPKEAKDVDPVCARMCVDALRDGMIRADAGKKFSLLNERDAVEFIYQTVKKKDHKHLLYHLSSGSLPA